MRVLVAPDKFRGTLSATQAAGAIAVGWRRARPSDAVEEAPMADGGEGTLDALVDALDGERRTATVSGPLGDPVQAAFGLVETHEGRTAVVEMAAASGVALLGPDRRDPRRTTTRGTGELLLAACRTEPPPRRAIVCIGGSATNDGGAGMAQALGIRLLDGEGRPLGPGGAELLRLARVDASSLAREVRSAAIVVASDVDNPLVGPEGASAVYGPQKGASPEDVFLLDRALRHYAAVLHRDLGIDVRDRPGAGAAGGLGAGLIAFLGARLRPGVEVVMDAVGLRARIERADLVVTGEGRFDRQSLRGKTAAGVLAAAGEAGVPVVVVCGQAEEGVEPEGVEVVSLAERFGMERAMQDTRRALEELSAELAASSADPSGRGEVASR